MSCPTCDHTMAKLTEVDPIYFVCDRCGTLTRIVGTHRDDYVPKLVRRCREFRAARHPSFKAEVGIFGDPVLAAEWHRIGIAESINLPEDR